MDITTNDLILQKITALHHHRRNIMKMPAEEGMEAILTAEAPAALVHAFPVEDLYFFIQEIGPDDTLDILALASDSQWEYILDVETWDKDRVDLKELTLWFNRLLLADPKRFIGWCYRERRELISLYLNHNIDILIRDPDQDPSDFPDEYTSDDDTYFIKILNPSEEKKELKDYLEIRQEFLIRFLKKLTAHDHIKYQSLLQETRKVLPAEIEEENYRLRCVRLAENGLLPFDEAIGVYQPLSAKDILRAQAKVLPLSSSGKTFAIVPHYLTNLMESDNVFATLLHRIQNDDLLLKIQVEFVNLCNQIIVADSVVRKEREHLETIVKKATGFINIGIEKIMEERVDVNDPIQLIETYLLADIFRAGYGAALSLKWKARKFRELSWVEKNGLSLNFWGEKWLGVLGGLLIKKPLFYSNYQKGKLYQEFETADQIVLTDKILEDIGQVDQILSQLDIELSSFAHFPFLTYKNLLLTLWANAFTEKKTSVRELIPITPAAFKPFFESLWTEKGTTRKVSDTMKENFLKWLSTEISEDIDPLSQKTAHIFEDLFGELESEYRHISPSDLDPRYIHHFIIRRH